MPAALPLEAAVNCCCDHLVDPIRGPLGPGCEAPIDLERSLHEQYARVGRAMANPGRVALLDSLSQAERTVEDLASAVGMSFKDTSAQWREPRLAGELARTEGVDVRGCCFGDAVGCAVAGQVVPDGWYHLYRMFAGILHSEVGSFRDQVWGVSDDPQQPV